MKKFLLAALILLATTADAAVRRLDVPHGWYGDNRTDGQYAALIRGSHLQTSSGTVPLPQAGDDVLSIRVTPNGPFKIAGQSHNGGGNFEWSGTWRRAGDSYGVNPVIYDFAGVLHMGAPQFGSQGFRYVTPAGVLITGDATYADPSRRIWEYTTYGDTTIGQGEAGCIALRGAARYMLEPGDCRFVRFTRDGDLFAVSMVKQLEDKTVFLWFTAADLASFQPEGSVPTPPVPVPTPVPTPTPEVDCGTVPEAGQAALRQLATLFASEIRSTNDDTRRVWALKAAQQMAFTVGPEWGTKNAGGGRPQSKDGIAKEVRPGHTTFLCGWDIVNGTTRELSFGRGELLPGQVFMPVTPTNHLGGSAPGPTPTPGVDPRIAQLEAQVAQLNARHTEDWEAREAAEQASEMWHTRLVESEKTLDDTRKERDALLNAPVKCVVKPSYLRLIGGCEVVR